MATQVAYSSRTKQECTVTSAPSLCLDCARLHALLLLAAGLLSVETYTCCDRPPPEQQMRQLLSVVDIFSPNKAEAESIVGAGTPQQLVDRLLQLGARLVALRMGEKGVLLARQQEGGQLECCAVSATAGS